MSGREDIFKKKGKSWKQKGWGGAWHGFYKEINYWSTWVAHEAELLFWAQVKMSGVMRFGPWLPAQWESAWVFSFPLPLAPLTLALSLSLFLSLI